MLTSKQRAQLRALANPIETILQVGKSGVGEQLVKQVDDALTARGVEVLWDDRPVSAGVMFSDADLLGVPYRVIVSPRNLKQGIVEVVSRDKQFSATFPVENAKEEILALLEKANG